MANIVGELIYKITGDSSGLQRSITSVNKSGLSLAENLKRNQNLAKALGQEFNVLATRQALLKSKITELISKGVDPANKGLKKLTDEFAANQLQIEKSQKGFSGFGLAAKAALAGIAVAAARFGLSFTQNIIKTASDAEEVANKFGVVFSRISGDANRAANSLAEGYGLSRTAAKQLLSDTGDLLTGFGFTQQEALATAESVNKLAVDLASFTNFSGGAEGASAALTKALLGEREAIKSLGIAIGEEDIKEYAKQQGLAADNLTRQQKAQITLQLAIKQSANAIGDFERSQDSFANQTRKLNAEWENFKEILGNQVLPVATQLVGALGRILNTIVSLSDALRYARAEEQRLATVQQEQKEATEEANKAALERIKIFTADQNTLEKREKILNNEILLLEKEAQAILDASFKQGGYTLETEELINKKKEEIRVRQQALGILQGEAAASKEAAKTKKELTDAERAWLAARTSIYSEVQQISDKLYLSEEQLARRTADERIKGLQQYRKANEDISAQIKAVNEQLENDLKEIRQNALSERLSEAQQFISVIGGLFGSVGQIAANFNQARSDEIEKRFQDEKIAIEKSGLAEADRVAKIAELEERYNAEKRQAQRKAAEDARAFAIFQATLSSVTGVMNAISAGWKFGPVGAGVFAALATAAGIAQIAAAASTPIPQFANGGIVPGTSYTGDQQLARVNSGEMILNQSQQAKLFDTIGGGAGGEVMRVAPMSVKSTFDELFRASQRGELFIASRAVV